MSGRPDSANTSLNTSLNSSISGMRLNTSVRTTATLSMSLGVERLAIVLDIGSAYTKAGFAAEHAPRVLIPSKVKVGGKETSITNPALDAAELHEALIDFLFKVFFTELLVKPQDRRIVIVEDLLSPHVFRQALADVLFSHFMVASIVFVPAPLMSVMALGLDTALVVDVGHDETRCVGVYRGNVLIKSYTALPLGATAVHQSVHSLLLAHSRVFDGPTLKPLLAYAATVAPRVVEDITVRTCLCAKAPLDAKGKPVKASTVLYPLSNTVNVEVPDIVRTQACNALFDGSFEGLSLQSIILDAIEHAPRDIRMDLAENLVVTGGTSMLRGLPHRLMDELHALAKSDAYANLAGVPIKAIELTVQLTSLDGNADAGLLKADSDIFSAHVLTKLNLAADQLCDVTAEAGVGASVTAKFTLTHDVDASPLNGTAIHGKRSYSFDSVVKREVTHMSGLDAALAIHQPDLPANILPWVGAAVFASLESLQDRSLSRDTYNKNGNIIPDWLRIEAKPEASVEATAPNGAVGIHWTSLDRPREWGFGSIAVQKPVSLVP